MNNWYRLHIGGHAFGHDTTLAYCQKHLSLKDCYRNAKSITATFTFQQAEEKIKVYLVFDKSGTIEYLYFFPPVPPYYNENDKSKEACSQWMKRNLGLTDGKRQFWGTPMVWYDRWSDTCYLVFKFENPQESSS